MVRLAALWQHSPMAGHLRYPDRWIFCLAALGVWLALGWPVLEALSTGAAIRGTPVSPLWLVPFTLFAAAVVAAAVLEPRPAVRWTMLAFQLAAVAAMAIVVNWAMMAMFL